MQRLVIIMTMATMLKFDAYADVNVNIDAQCERTLKQSAAMIGFLQSCAIPAL